MRTFICPQCGIANDRAYKRCRKCDFPIKKSLSLSSFLILPILILLFIMLFSVGAFIYIEANHPSYGIRSRFTIMWDVLTDEQWVTRYRELEKSYREKNTGDAEKKAQE